MSSGTESPKLWFVGRGVVLWRRADFEPRGIPFHGFVTDYRDGLIEVIALDAPDYGRKGQYPEAGRRAWVLWTMLGGIEDVDDTTLAEWEAKCGVKVVRPETPGDDR